MNAEDIRAIVEGVNDDPSVDGNYGENLDEGNALDINRGGENCDRLDDESVDLITPDIVLAFEDTGVHHTIQSLRPVISKLMKNQIVLQNNNRILTRNNIKLRKEIERLLASINSLVSSTDEKISQMKKEHEDDIKRLENRLNNVNSLSHTGSPLTNTGNSMNRESGAPQSRRGSSASLSAGSGQEILALMPIYKDDGHLSPPRFVLEFERVAEQFGLEEKRKIIYFCSRVKVPNPMWDLGLNTSDCEFIDYKEAFLASYWSRESQKTLKKKFQEAKIVYTGAAALQSWLKNWFNQLSSLTYGSLNTEEIIEQMIHKFPPTCRDLLRVVDHSDFSIFVERAVQVVNENHFRDRYNFHGGTGRDRDFRGNKSRGGDWHNDDRHGNEYNHNKRSDRRSNDMSWKNSSSDRSWKNDHKRGEGGGSYQNRERNYDNRSQDYDKSKRKADFKKMDEIEHEPGQGNSKSLPSS